jgi:hypothetical protein
MGSVKGGSAILRCWRSSARREFGDLAARACTGRDPRHPTALSRRIPSTGARFRQFRLRKSGRFTAGWPPTDGETPPPARARSDVGQETTRAAEVYGLPPR